jgi:hypothetical protein
MQPGSRAFRLLEVVTVGFPFCAFKVLTGSVFLSFPNWSAPGWALIVVGGVDLLLNVIAFVFAALGRDNPLPVCIAQWAVTRWGAGRSGSRRLGLSVDTMFAFTLVAAMIGFGWFVHLPHGATRVWSLGVVFNVLGAGLGRLAESVIDVGPPRRQG